MPSTGCPCAFCTRTITSAEVGKVRGTSPEGMVMVELETCTAKKYPEGTVGPASLGCGVQARLLQTTIRQSKSQRAPSTLHASRAFFMVMVSRSTVAPPLGTQHVWHGVKISTDSGRALYLARIRPLAVFS